jgi:hypothetical protein
MANRVEPIGPAGYDCLVPSGPCQAAMSSDVRRIAAAISALRRARLVSHRALRDRALCGDAVGPHLPSQFSESGQLPGI